MEWMGEKCLYIYIYTFSSGSGSVRYIIIVYNSI